MLPIIASIGGRAMLRIIVAGLIGMVIGVAIQDERDAKRIEEVKAEVEEIERRIREKKRT